MYWLPKPEVTDLFGEDGVKQWDLAVKLQDFYLEKTTYSEYNILYTEELELWQDTLRIS